MAQNLEKYLEALREAVGEERFPIARAQVNALGRVLTRERRRELESGRDNGVRREILDKRYGGFLADEVKNLVSILAEKKELSLLDGILDDEESGDSAVVTTARKISGETRNWLSEELKLACGANKIDFKEDKNIIGGVRIKIGSREVDATMRTKISL